jgi:hypothetical protein
MVEHFSAAQDTLTTGQLVEAVNTRVLRDRAQMVEWSGGEQARLQAFAFAVTSSGVANYVATSLENHRVSK